MDKGRMEVIHHYKQSIDWVNSLGKLPEEKWRTPIEEGKWTIAEIIGHLMPWDEFVLNQRIPYIMKAVQLPKSPDVELVNQLAAKLSRDRSKDETIHLFIDIRKSLLEGVSDLPEELWTQNVTINASNKPLFDYFTGLIEHDLHHFKQIQNVL